MMRILTAAAASATIAALLVSVGAGTCTELRPLAKQVLDVGDVQAAKQIYEQVHSVCDAVYVDAYGRQIAKLLFAEAVAGDKTDEALLSEALRYGRPWQLLATLGDIDAGRKDWVLATRHYQEAVTEINDVQRTPQKPDDDLIKTVFKKAETARLLASQYVETTRGVGGENEGLALFDVRGISFNRMAVPVQFQFGKAEMTETGVQAAKDMAEYLKNDKTLTERGIRLVGHTDPVGGDAYNLTLSQNRAKALAVFLQANGVAIPIQTDGKGKLEPYQPDQASKYTQDEQYRMDRRVELNKL
jgi:OmpA-OmpF porin, OOP family